MSDKMSEVDWENDEAVVRAAIGGGGSCWGGYGNDPKVFRIWSRALPGGTDPSSILLGIGGSPKEAWASARQHSVVAYFDRDNRPVIEVEAAKKAVLTGPCEGGECWWNPETGYLEACPKHESQGMEAMMAKDAASKLTPAAVAGDTAKCGKFAGSLHPRLGLSYTCVLELGHAGDCKRGGTCFMHGAYVGENCSAWPSCVGSLTGDSAPVGDREGEFEAFADGIYIGDFPDTQRATIRQLMRHSWNTRAALASKPSAEGIPEIVVPEEKNDWSDEHWRMYESGRAGMLRAYDADNVAWDKYDHQILRLQMKIEAAQAIISAKDAEIARITAERFNPLGDNHHNALMCPHCNSGHRELQAELAALKLSSARIEEETLRKAAGIYVPDSLRPLSALAAIMWMREQILALIHTSPESQKSKEEL